MAKNGDYRTEKALGIQQYPQGSIGRGLAEEVGRLREENAELRFRLNFIKQLNRKMAECLEKQS